MKIKTHFQKSLISMETPRDHRDLFLGLSTQVWTENKGSVYIKKKLFYKVLFFNDIALKEREVTI